MTLEEYENLSKIEISQAIRSLLHTNLKSFIYRQSVTTSIILGLYQSTTLTALYIIT